MTITNATLTALETILENLRPLDEQELFATRGAIHKQDLAKEIMAVHDRRRGVAHIAWHEGRPVAAWGAYSITPAALVVWAFGTPEWRHVVRQVTRHVREFMIPALLKVGFHHAECRSLATRRDSHRWLTALGFQPKAELSGFGIRRETFILFAWALDNDLSQSSSPDHSVRIPPSYH